MTLLERLDERWERMDGAAATKIDRILKERREAADEIKRLRAVLVDARDLLLEVKQGSPARSAGHNARLVIEAALKPLT